MRRPGARSCETDLARVDRQIRRWCRRLPTPVAAARLVEELRDLEQRQDGLRAGIAAAGTPEPLPALHPNLAQVYRQKVERLEQALHDPSVSAAAVEALRSLIDAIVVYPGERRGEVSLELRGDLAAFLHLADDGPAGRDPATGRRENRRSPCGERRFCWNDGIVGCGGRI